MTFDEVAKREPRLYGLYAQAKAWRVTVALSKAYDEMPKEGFCANQVWYDLFKPILVSLIGWEYKGKDDVLKSREAYDVAYQTLYDTLPDCTHEPEFMCS